MAHEKAFININGIPTKVATRGGWITGKDSDPPRDIVLVIPGNPGVVSFYDEFLNSLYEDLEWPVWIVAHSGHEYPKEKDTVPKLKDRSQTYALKGQVEQKISFIKKYVPKNARIHLVGHSIGSYVSLQIMKNPEINSQITDVHLLFPTIEYMAETKNGKFLTNIVKPIVKLTIFLSWIFTLLPRVISGFFLFIYMLLNNIPNAMTIPILKLVQPLVLQNVFFLAFEEMGLVRERDDELIKENVDKLRLLYGATDGWAPTEYCDRLKRDIPDIQTTQSKFQHTFIFHESRQVASWITDKLKIKQEN